MSDIDFLRHLFHASGRIRKYYSSPLNVRVSDEPYDWGPLPQLITKNISINLLYTVLYKT